MTRHAALHHAALEKTNACPKVGALVATPPAGRDECPRFHYRVTGSRHSQGRGPLVRHGGDLEQLPGSLSQGGWLARRTQVRQPNTERHDCLRPLSGIAANVQHIRDDSPFSHRPAQASGRRRVGRARVSGLVEPTPPALLRRRRPTRRVRGCLLR